MRRGKAIRQFAIKESGKYDLVLSNPPFGYINEDERFFYRKEFSDTALKSLLNKRCDVNAP